MKNNKKQTRKIRKEDREVSEKSKALQIREKVFKQPNKSAFHGIR